MLTIYFDSGAYLKELKPYKNKVNFMSFKSENKNKNIKNKALPPSNMTWKDYKKMPPELHGEHTLGNLTSKDFDSSDKIEEIIKVVGAENKNDIWHLDSAYKSKCDLFLTSDKDDIYSKKDTLEPLLGFRIFLAKKQINEIIEFIENHDN